MRILAIGAHPDDVDIGCAGLLQRGDTRRIVVLSQGECGGDQAVRSVEQEQSAAILGAGCAVYSLRDRDVGHLQAIELLEAEIYTFRPDFVLTEPADDTHQDHRAVHAATLVAVRDLCGTVLSYFSPSAAERWRPDWFVPLGEDAMTTKVRAVACHRSQSDRSYMAAEYIRGAGRYWALVTRAESPYVEAYQLVRHREAR